MRLLRQNCDKFRADGEKRAFIWAYVTINLPESVEISQSPTNLFPSVINVCLILANQSQVKAQSLAWGLYYTGEQTKCCLRYLNWFWQVFGPICPNEWPFLSIRSGFFAILSQMSDFQGRATSKGEIFFSWGLRYLNWFWQVFGHICPNECSFFSISSEFFAILSQKSHF